MKPPNTKPKQKNTANEYFKRVIKKPETNQQDQLGDFLSSLTQNSEEIISGNINKFSG